MSKGLKLLLSCGALFSVACGSGTMSTGNEELLDAQSEVSSSEEVVTVGQALEDSRQACYDKYVRKEITLRQLLTCLKEANGGTGTGGGTSVSCSTSYQCVNNVCTCSGETNQGTSCEKETCSTTCRVCTNN